MSGERPTMTVTQFLTSAGLFEGAILGLAMLAGWLTSVDPLGSLHWSFEEFQLGVLATGPLLLMLTALLLSRARGLVQIREYLRDFLGPLLNDCRWYDIVLLSLLAGVCEEIMFRGFLYFWIRQWNPVLAVIVTNLLFGIAHAVTPLYALLAAFIGIYLTALVAADATPNLLVPITAHTLYDIVAFVVVIRDYRRHTAAS